MSDWFRWHESELLLEIRVTPRASRDEFFLSPRGLGLRLTAPPTDNLANSRLIRILAKAFGVPKRNIQIRRGEHSREKLVAIDNPTRIEPSLAAYIRLP